MGRAQAHLGQDMKLISSSEFRKTYQHLNEPTMVLTHGHVIGVWTPQGVQVVNQYGTIEDQAKQQEGQREQRSV